jgi:hypothetical protein
MGSGVDGCGVGLDGVNEREVGAGSAEGFLHLRCKIIL